MLHRWRAFPTLRPVLVTKPAVMPVTLDEAKVQCRESSNDEDGFISALIETAVQYLDGWSGILGRCMINQTWRFSARSWPACGMSLPFPNVSAVSITYRDLGDVEQTLSDADRRLIDIATGTFVEWTASFAAPACFDRTDAIAFDVTSGFGPAAADVPRPLRHAVLMLVEAWFNNREAYSPDGGKELPFAVTQLIAGFRRNTV